MRFVINKSWNSQVIGISRGICTLHTMGWNLLEEVFFILIHQCFHQIFMRHSNIIAWKVKKCLVKKQMHEINNTPSKRILSQCMYNVHTYLHLTYIYIHRRDVVRFSNPGELIVIDWIFLFCSYFWTPKFGRGGGHPPL